MLSSLLPLPLEHQNIPDGFIVPQNIQFPAWNPPQRTQQFGATYLPATSGIIVIYLLVHFELDWSWIGAQIDEWRRVQYYWPWRHWRCISNWTEMTNTWSFMIRLKLGSWYGCRTLISEGISTRKIVKCPENSSLQSSYQKPMRFLQVTCAFHYLPDLKNN